MNQDPRPTGLNKLAHKLRHFRSGKAYRGARRAVMRCRGRPVAHFLHVRKAGGSAIKTALTPHATTGPYLVELHPHRITLNDVPVGEKVFFVVRDPVARFVSGFYSRLRQGAPAHTVPWTEAERTAFEQFPTPNALGLALASDEPATQEAARQAMRQITHVNSSYWDWFIDEPTLRRRAEDVLFIARQERLNEAIPRLLEQLQLPADISLPGDPTRANRGARHEDRQLDPAARAAIEQAYASDYAFLTLCAELFGEDIARPAENT
jgi:hypothetical protein